DQDHRRLSLYRRCRHSLRRVVLGLAPTRLRGDPRPAHRPPFSGCRLHHCMGGAVELPDLAGFEMVRPEKDGRTAGWKIASPGKAPRIAFTFPVPKRDAGIQAPDSK